jgi:hypothetical protein
LGGIRNPASPCHPAFQLVIPDLIRDPETASIIPILIQNPILSSYSKLAVSASGGIRDPEQQTKKFSIINLTIQPSNYLTIQPFNHLPSKPTKTPPLLVPFLFAIVIPALPNSFFFHAKMSIYREFILFLT